jgi:hypothetical protein
MQPRVQSMARCVAPSQAGRFASSWLLYQGMTSQFAEKLSRFERAQLQLCRKARRMNAALAAEGRFSFCCGLFPQAVQPCRKASKKMGSKAQRILLRHD